MGIDISTYAGTGIFIPADNTWMQSHEDDYEAEDVLWSDILDKKILTLVRAEDSWSGRFDGLVVFVKRTLRDSDREFMLKRSTDDVLTPEETAALKSVSEKIGIEFQVEHIAVVTVT